MQTVDFFPPMVDDPYLFGQIAAANALSDIYAMGARPRLAMNLLAYPACLPPEAVRAILAGGADKVREADAVLAGGHTIQDNEPKYGLCVTGFAHPGQILSNAAACPGDVLLLTKPLGTGILNTAAKADLLTDAEIRTAADSMAQLNRKAAEALQGCEAHACTDVTGFGLLGHAYEMASASGVSIRLFSGEVPYFEKAADLAQLGILPAGVYSTYDYLEGKVSWHNGVQRYMRDIMADPQTSGGLLISLPPAQAGSLLSYLTEEVTPWARIIGEVSEKQAMPILVE